MSQDRVGAASPLPGGRLPELVLVVVTLVWGGTFLVTHLVLRETGPFAFLALRFSVGAVALLLFFARRMRGLSRGELRAGAAIGVVTFASYSLQTFGLQHIVSSKSAFITALYVPVVPLLQLALLRKPPRLSAWVGIVVSFAGLLLLSVGDGFDLAFGTGEALTLGGALMAAMQIVLVSRWAPRADPMRLATVQLAVVAGLSLLAIPLAGEPLPAPTPGLLAAGIGMGLIATAFALGAMSWAQQTVSPTRATVIYSMEPVWAGGIGAVAGEALTAPMLGGSGLILLGVLVSELPWRSLLRRPASPAAPAGASGEAGEEPLRLAS